MARGKKLSKRVSKKIFSRAGSKINLINVKSVPMRGGYRI